MFNPRATARVLGQKLYELTDHLGNVRAVVTDQKTSALSSSTGLPLLSSLQPVLSAYYNYYPFGQLQPGRYGPADPTASGGYRYGFNGKEKDNNGELGLTTYDYGFRIYNPGLARFLSVDPLASSYPELTPYQFAGNMPIAAIDVDGEEPKVVTQRTGQAFAPVAAAATATEVVTSVERGTTVVSEAGELIAPVLKGLSTFAKVAGMVVGTVVLVFTPANNGSGAMRASLTGEDTFQKNRFKDLINKPYSTLTEKEKSELGNLSQHFALDEKRNVIGTYFKSLNRSPNLSIFKDVDSFEKFVLSAEAPSKKGNGLTEAGRALQKHIGRPGEHDFSKLTFSGKTANAEAMEVVNSILNSDHQLIYTYPDESIEIYDKSTGFGLEISRFGKFNGFRDFSKHIEN